MSHPGHFSIFNTLCPRWIMHIRHHLQILKWNAKRGQPEMPFILGRSGTQYAPMVKNNNNNNKKLLSSSCGRPLVESYCQQSKISDTNWLRHLFFHYI